MNFKVEETITLRDYVEFNASYVLQSKVTGKVVRGASGFLTGWRIFGGGCLLLLGVAAMVGGLIGGFFSALGAICLIGGFYLIRKPMKTPRDRAVEPFLARQTGKEPSTHISFYFDEEGFDVFELNGNSSYRYFVLTDVWEDPNRFYLFTEGKLSFILQKSGFVEGKSDDFSAWIAKKIGKDIRKVAE